MARLRRNGWERHSSHRGVTGSRGEILIQEADKKGQTHGQDKKDDLRSPRVLIAWPPVCAVRAERAFAYLFHYICGVLSRQGGGTDERCLSTSTWGQRLRSLSGREAVFVEPLQWGQEARRCEQNLPLSLDVLISVLLNALPIKHGREGKKRFQS